MIRYVALLRGINVGGKNKISMADLKTMLTDLGHSDVGTLLNSGNAVFGGPRRDTGELAAVLDAEIARRFRLDVKTVVRTADEMRAVVEADPFVGVATDPAKYVVMFLSGTPDRAALDAIDPNAYAPEEFRYVGREFYVWCPNSLRDARLPVALAHKRLGVVATARNWNTVTKLLTMMVD